MADYYPLIARAVAGLEKNSGENRRALYERARSALVAQLRGVDPPLEETEVTRERLALEESIRKVEAEAARRARSEALAPPPPPPPPPAAPTPPQQQQPAGPPPHAPHRSNRRLSRRSPYRRRCHRRPRRHLRHRRRVPPRRPSMCRRNRRSQASRGRCRKFRSKFRSMRRRLHRLHRRVSSRAALRRNRKFRDSAARPPPQPQLNVPPQAPPPPRFEPRRAPQATPGQQPPAAPRPPSRPRNQAPDLDDMRRDFGVAPAAPQPPHDPYADLPAAHDFDRLDEGPQPRIDPRALRRPPRAEQPQPNLEPPPESEPDEEPRKRGRVRSPAAACGGGRGERWHRPLLWRHHQNRDRGGAADLPRWVRLLAALDLRRPLSGAARLAVAGDASGAPPARNRAENLRPHRAADAAGCGPGSGAARRPLRGRAVRSAGQALYRLSDLAHRNRVARPRPTARTRRARRCRNPRAPHHHEILDPAQHRSTRCRRATRSKSCSTCRRILPAAASPTCPAS